jgi:2-hydroxycyclohexanecarboxyl-CoA dehydrogenase
VLDIDGEAAERAVAELSADGARAVGAHVDVADRSSVDAAFDRIRAELGAIEILVTSAAVSGFVPFRDITLDVWERTMTVNLTGTFNCLQSALPDMVTGGWGRVVTISCAFLCSDAASYITGQVIGVNGGAVT